MAKNKWVMFIFPWLAWFFAMLFYLHQYLLRFSMSALSPELRVSYHLTATEVADINNAFYYSFIIMQFVAGFLIDRFGARIMLFLGSILCSIGCFIFAEALYVYGLDVSRIIMGIGAPLALVGTLKLASSWFDARRFALVSGVTIALGSLGAFFSEGVLAILLDSISWRSLVNALGFVGILIAAGIFFLVHNSPRKDSVEAKIQRKVTLKLILINLCKVRVIWIMLFFAFMQTTLFCFAGLWAAHYFTVKYSLSFDVASFICGLFFLGYAPGSILFSYLSGVLKRRARLLLMANSLVILLYMLIIYFPLHVYVLGLIVSAVLLLGFFSSICSICYIILKEQVDEPVVATLISLMIILAIVVCGIINHFMGNLIDHGQSLMQILRGFDFYTSDAYSNSFVLITVSLFISLFSAIVYGYFEWRKNISNNC